MVLSLSCLWSHVVLRAIYRFRPGFVACALSNPSTPVVSIVQGQGVADTMGDLCVRRHPPCIDLDPVAIVHRKDLSVEGQQGIEAWVVPSSRFQGNLRA